MMPKGTKKCKYCGKRKPVGKFGKDKPYCKTCHRLYFKHLKTAGRHAVHSEREQLLKRSWLKTEQSRRAIRNMIENYPEEFKIFRKYLRYMSNSVSGRKKADMTAECRRYYYKTGKMMCQSLVEEYG